MELNKIYNEDCIVGMEKIEDGSVDLLLTDPPYNISMKSNFHTMGRTGVDFGEWDKGFDQRTWLEVALKKVRKGGSVVIFNSWKNIGELKEVLEANGFVLKELIQWKKTNPMPRNRDRRFIADYEVAVWAVKPGGKWTFNRLSDTYERPEIVCKLTPKSEKVNSGHPTQKPVEVMEWLINRLSNESDLILDPFMGSGSTGVACMNTNRKFIGIELDEKYFNMVKDRLENIR